MHEKIRQTDKWPLSVRSLVEESVITGSAALNQQLLTLKYCLTDYKQRAELHNEAASIRAAYGKKRNVRSVVKEFF